jgi:hypothetical protein
MDESPRPQSFAKPFFTYRRARTALYAYAGIINPVICFGCAAPRGNWLADPPWQSGQFWVYATLMMKWPAVLPFYPVLIYSMTCLGLFLWNSKRFVSYFAVRIGVYGGIVLSALFGVFLFSAADPSARAIVETAVIFAIIATATVFGLTILAAVLLVFRAVAIAIAEMLGGWRRLAALSAALLIAFIAIAWAVNPSELQDGAGAMLFVPLIVSLGCGPTWALLAYTAASVELLTRDRPDKWRWKITDALLLTGWIAAAFAAWRNAMDMAIQEYATLPTEDPSCFVCTAAARGHWWLVGSEVIARGKRRRLVTHQLRVLKAAELALLAICPLAHRVARRVYNRVGPMIARRIKNAWLADAAYLALKPAEWLAAIWLCTLLGADREKISRLYCTKSHAEP